MVPLAGWEGGATVNTPAIPGDKDWSTRRYLDILAVVGLVASVANGAAFALVLRQRWFWEFFNSWEAPVLFTCLSIALVVACGWMVDNVEGLYRIAAAAGAVVSAITSVVLMILAAIGLMLLAARFVLENMDRKPRRSYPNRNRGRRRKRYR